MRCLFPQMDLDPRTGAIEMVSGVIATILVVVVKVNGAVAVGETREKKTDAATEGEQTYPCSSCQAKTDPQFVRNMIPATFC